MQKIFKKNDSHEREHLEDQTAKDKLTESIRATSVGDLPDGPTDAQHARDVNSHTIFRNQRLTCQFLRDYTDLSIFSDLQPEDIEDVTDRYRAFLDIEFEADTVKKIRIKTPEGTREVFVIPLIEHKTRVDYDVAMQLLRYMAVIWYDYKKQQEGLQEGSSGRKSFRYPPIIPIVYYEGKANWTADLRLSDRIDLSAAGLGEYIPNFTYKVVRVHGYGNEELKKKQNEMSLVMMLNRIQTLEDYTEFLETYRDYADEIYNGTQEDIRTIYRDVLWSLFRKMNMPVEEAREKLAEMEESGMGYLFADMDKIDIQAERRNMREARQEAEEANRKLEEANQKLEESSQKLEESNQKLEESNQKLEESNQKLEESSQKLEESNQKLEESNQKLEESNQKLEESNQKLEESNQKLEESSQKLEESNQALRSILGQLILLCQKEHLSKDETLSRLQEQYKISAELALSAVNQFWEK